MYVDDTKTEWSFYKISLPQDPNNHWLLTRMSFDYEEEEDYDPVEQEKGWVLDFFCTLYLKFWKGHKN